MSDQRTERKTPGATLQQELADALVESGYRRAYGVPDSVLGSFVQRAEERLPLEYLPREDLAVAAAVGSSLGGSPALVFMKNAGLGNSVDALLSLARASTVPISIVMGMSGVGSDRLPHHTVVGERAEALLEATGIVHRTLTPDADPRSLAQWLHRKLTARESAAVLVPPP